MPPDQPAAIAPPAPGDGWGRVRGVFLAWEGLRVIYNVVLVAETALLAALSGEGTRGAGGFWLECVAGGIAANLLFFLGPVAESYAGWLGVPAAALRPGRWAVFGAGLVFSMLLAAVGVLLWDAPF